MFLMAQLFISVAFFPMGDLKGMLSCKQEARQPIGKTTTLKQTALGASFTAGKSFMSGHKGRIFYPQFQIVYQNVHFDKTSYIDGFNIEIGKLDLWLMLGVWAFKQDTYGFLKREKFFLSMKSFILPIVLEKNNVFSWR